MRLSFRIFMSHLELRMVGIIHGMRRQKQGGFRCVLKSIESEGVLAEVFVLPCRFGLSGFSFYY
jgi:hypothetical protein